MTLKKIRDGNLSSESWPLGRFKNQDDCGNFFPTWPNARFMAIVMN